MQGSSVQFDFEDVSPVEKRLNVQVARDLVSTKLDEAYRKLNREVNLRGFRPGKAPRPILERMYGKQVERTVAEELINDSMMQVAQGQALRMVTQPTLEAFPEIRKGEAMKFSARVELYPQVEPKEYEGLEVTRTTEAVTDADIDAALEERRQQQQEMIPIEGRETVAEGDFLVLSVSGKVGKGDYKNAEFPVDLSEPQRSIMPFLAPALIGIPLNATDHPVKFTFPTEHTDPEVAGQEFEPRITIKSAHLRRLPTLDDEFAKDTGEAETLAELREKVRASLQEQENAEAKEELRGKLMEELVKRNPVHLPPSLLGRVAESLLEPHRRRAVLDAVRAGRDPQAVDINELRKLAAEEAMRTLSVEFVLLAVAEKESVEVNEAEVEKRLSELARQTEKSVSRLKAELQKEDQGLMNLRTQLRLEKALDLIESKAVIKDEAPAESAAPAEATPAP